MVAELVTAVGLLLILSTGLSSGDDAPTACETKCSKSCASAKQLCLGEDCNPLNSLCGKKCLRECECEEQCKQQCEQKGFCKGAKGILGLVCGTLAQPCKGVCGVTCNIGRLVFGRPRKNKSEQKPKTQPGEMSKGEETGPETTKPKPETRPAPGFTNLKKTKESKKGSQPSKQKGKNTKKNKKAPKKKGKATKKNKKGQKKNGKGNKKNKKGKKKNGKKAKKNKKGSKNKKRGGKKGNKKGKRGKKGKGKKKRN